MLLLIQTNNLIFGFDPETLLMFFFGVVMVFVAIGLRWLLGQENEKKADGEPVTMIAPDSTNGNYITSGNLRVNEK